MAGGQKNLNKLGLCQLRSREKVLSAFPYLPSRPPDDAMTLSTLKAVLFQWVNHPLPCSHGHTGRCARPISLVHLKPLN